MTPSITVFDGHNDVLLRLREHGGSFFDRADDAHLDFSRAREGGFGGGFFAVFVPTEVTQAQNALDVEDAADRAMTLFSDVSTMPPSPDLAVAQRVAIAMTALLFRIEEQSEGRVKVVRTVQELTSCIDQDIMAAVLHFEGAEAIDTNMESLEVFYRAGLRSIGPVWSRPNAFGEGVPFAFPSTPDTGAGLTAAGRELVHACNRLGIMIDLSHLNEKGFWDVAALSDAPLVATHSNAHALCPSSRNLTDRQLAAIKESDGMVGLNFNVGFLREDGGREKQTPLSVLVRHIEYLVDKLGIDRVGLGSDFDGATMPADLADAAALPMLIAALAERGFDQPSLRKIGHENWIRVLNATWK